MERPEVLRTKAYPRSRQNHNPGAPIMNAKTTPTPPPSVRENRFAELLKLIGEYRERIGHPPITEADRRALSKDWIESRLSLRNWMMNDIRSRLAILPPKKVK
jgi:hypothetical protein